MNRDTYCLEDAVLREDNGWVGEGGRVRMEGEEVMVEEEGKVRVDAKVDCNELLAVGSSFRRRKFVQLV